MTLLFLTTVLPAEATTGGESASRAFVDGLRRAGNRVVVVGYRRRGSELEPGPDDRSAGERRIETDTAGAAPLGWLAKALALRLPYSVAKYRSRRYRQAVREAIAEVQPDLLICDHAQASAGLPRGNLSVPLIYLAHNLEHRLYRDAANRSRGPLRLLNRREARRMLSLEMNITARAQEVWALTEADALVLDALADSPVRVFALPPTAAPPAPAEPQHDVVMLGTWTWKANEAGLRWFADEVHPLLDAGTSVAIGGRGAEPVAGEIPGVTCAGFVEDSMSFLAAGRVVVVPAVAGEGVQIKTLDAIAAGRPTVTTSLALRGIDSPPSTVRVADEPEAMAAAIGALLREPAATEPAAEAVSWVGRRRADFEAALGAVAAAGTAETPGTAGGPA